MFRKLSYTISDQATGNILFQEKENLLIPILTRQLLHDQSIFSEYPQLVWSKFYINEVPLRPKNSKETYFAAAIPYNKLLFFKRRTYNKTVYLFQRDAFC